MPDIPTLYMVSMFVSGFVAALQYFMSRRICRATLQVWALANGAFCIGHLIFLIRPLTSFSVSTTLANTLLVGGTALMSTGTELFAGRRPRVTEAVAGPALVAAGFALSFALGASNTDRLFIVLGPLVYYLARTSFGLLRLTSHRGTGSIRILCATVLSGFAGLYVLRAIAAIAGLLGPGDVIANGGGSLIRAGVLVAILVWNFGMLYLVQEREAATDTLTGLFNRGATVASGQAMADLAAAAGRPFSILLLDLDRFKTVNDRFGHAAGDQVLRVFSDVMTRSVRQGDVVGRIGGEEFCILLPDCDAASARALAERLRVRCMEALARVEDLPVATTVSIGTATGTPGAGTISALMKDADSALYVAKASGRNRVCAAPAADADDPPEPTLRQA